MDSDGKSLDIEKCRQIVKEIVNFGVTQDQLLTIIQMLAFELEDHEQMQALTSCVRDFLRQRKFLFVDSYEESENKGG